MYEMYYLRKGKSKLLAFTYVLTPFILAQYIIQEDSSKNLILFIFILAWTFDTFAYLIGTRFGKRRILPSVSPKKSWEGLLGGFLCTIITAYLSQKYFNIPIKTALIIGIILPFTATLGDFIESYYKREAGVKDSGNIMPGHGGILDRMDAFMITIPAIYILINLINETP
jgi:phosphatidate cytidylyltransferase